jgi:type VI secretion system protein ImpE
LQALAALARGETADAVTLLSQADELSPSTPMVLNGVPVDGLRDADDRFGPILEVIGAGGNYCWVPFEHVASLTLNTPRYPRDVVYLPAHLEIKDGPAGDVLLPNLYPDSSAAPDDALRLGRATDWVEAPGEPVRGLGGKLFLSADGHQNLINWRELAARPGPAAPPGGDG